MVDEITICNILDKIVSQTVFNKDVLRTYHLFNMNTRQKQNKLLLVVNVVHAWDTISWVYRPKLGTNTFNSCPYTYRLGRHAIGQLHNKCIHNNQPQGWEGLSLRGGG